MVKKNKKRLHFDELQQLIDRRGLGQPKVLYYYFAFNLRHLAHWSLPPERAPPWFCIEQSVLTPLLPLQSLSVW